jgi:very-short-patch-repair endonuclease
LAIYIDTRWRPWAEEEKLRRRTIKLYSQLFTLQQQLDSGIVEATLELVCGVGIGIWNCKGTTVSYPLITRLAEVSLNPTTAVIEIRPRDVDARLEVDWYAAMDNQGVTSLEKASKDFFGKATQTFSPFDRGTFEPLLQMAVTHLDANGVYWPRQVPAEDRSLPKPEDFLKVTDTWVLFARPRNASTFIADLERFKATIEKLDDQASLPEAVAAVVTDPSTESLEMDLPTYRGVSGNYSSTDAGRETGKVKDLFFPKPFNDEQVRIVQLLEVSDGVCVQGPPGTGKTHTIANVICHYLANGKRVLVTSMKEPALTEVQNKLPEEIRPLAISLLTTEADGMQMFRLAIEKIASEVQRIDRTALAREIAHIDETIDAIHGRLARVDAEVGAWAKQNLTRIDLDDEHLDPQDAAYEVANATGQYERFPDSLGVDSSYAPKVTDVEIARLREARRALGPDILYLEATLPQLADFPESRLLLQAHQDLSRYAILKLEIEKGEVPALADSGQETLAAAQKLEDVIAELRRKRHEVESSRKSWSAVMREHLKSGGAPELIKILEALGDEIKNADAENRSFLIRPVSVPAGLDSSPDLIEAISNLAAGRLPFGLVGLVTKAESKRKLGEVRVLGIAPKSPTDWQHVERYVALLTKLRRLAVRWNALTEDLPLEPLPGTEAKHGLAAVESYKLYEKIGSVVHVEAIVCSSAAKVFPSWQGTENATEAPERLAALEKALSHHLTKNRLAETWAVKERFQRALEGCSGLVCEAIRLFLVNTLGNPEVPDATLQAEWSAAMAELSRIRGLSQHLADVRSTCARIADSGALKWAATLKLPTSGVADLQLPDNWRTVWRWRRLSSHLESIDPKGELKRLANHRKELDSDLARSYRDVVAKRTWLKLAENASPSVRAALMGYLNAVQKIGKGTGKRAVRYRQDARMAAAQANEAIPCWIMPHHRVSESLPPELGCFDLVVIDEGSQSDLTALPALLRASKVLIVGDDKQVSPEGVGLEEEKVRHLMNRFLGNQVRAFYPQLSPDRSIYDLFKVVFAKSGVMLKEHFRCVAPIIEYSKREFYGHELKPLRLPKASERLDPPLVDVFVEDGFRRGDINSAEARFIVEEIKQIVADPAMEGRSIGVVSLLADKQALHIWNRLIDELGPELMARHRIACGDARTFQGKERHIMFLSMVVAPNETITAISRDTFSHRFNVAASRAQDRMYLVRSVDPSQLSEADKLRRSLINHFVSPFAQDEARVENLRNLCESPFERDLYDALVERGYRVTPQVKVGEYRIDLVVEGHNDLRLAVECDGDRYHGPDKWADDIARQRVLERAGWVFWRSFASTYIRRRAQVIADLERALADRGVSPIGAEGAPRSIHAEHRRFSSTNALRESNVPSVVDDREARSI